VLELSGEQIAITHGDMSAVITEVGAALRCLRLNDEPIIWEFAADTIDSAARGQVLAPWPNRLQDGSYRFGDIEGRAAIDEQEQCNAIHGLVRWLPWTLEEHSDARAALSCVIHPQPAYPFRIRLELDYELDEDGLEVTCAATNTGPDLAPLGLGFHPYLLAGPAGIDEAKVALVAARRLLLDDRGLPEGEESVSGTAFDLHERTLGGLQLDDCYTGLETGPDGRWHARVDLPGRHSEIWAEAGFGYAMCYTGDSLASGDRRRAIAIEPMTCPPNALRTGTDLIELRPSEQWQASWGITAAID
jgi:aldose 1-epimerase